MASTICQDDANFNFLRCLNKCDGEVNGIANVVTNHSLIFMDLWLKMLMVYGLQLYLWHWELQRMNINIPKKRKIESRKSLLLVVR